MMVELSNIIEILFFVVLGYIIGKKIREWF